MTAQHILDYVARFDPAQPRDENGRWTNGMPSMISGVSLTLGGLASSVESRKDDRVRLAVGDAAIDMDRDRGTSRMTSVLSQSSGTHEVADDDGNTVLRVRYSAKSDTTTPHAAEVEMVDQGVTAQVSADDVEHLRSAMTVAGLARRIEIESGPTDLFVEDGNFGVRTTAGAMNFNQRSWKRLLDAENVVHEGFDEMGDYGPEGAEVDQLVVATNEGDITILRHGDTSTDEGTLITWGAAHTDDWFITHTGHYEDPWFQAVGEMKHVDARELSSGLNFSFDDSELSAPQPNARKSTSLNRNRGMRMTSTSRGDAAQARAQASRGGQLQRRDRPRQRRSDEVGGRGRVRAPLANPQIREADADGLLEFVGHASVTERSYNMWDWYGEYTEVISAGAFDSTLARGDLDVPLVLGHDQLRRIARTLNGTLDLSMDDDGLLVVARLDPADADVAYIVPKLRARLVDEMSFAFRITRGTWSPDYTEYRIDEVDIHRGDTAIVGYGANPHTDAGVRAAPAARSGAGTRIRALLELAIARG